MNTIQKQVFSIDRDSKLNTKGNSSRRSYNPTHPNLTTPKNKIKSTPNKPNERISNRSNYYSLTIYHQLFMIWFIISAGGTKIINRGPKKKLWVTEESKVKSINHHDRWRFSKTHILFSQFFVWENPPFFLDLKVWILKRTTKTTMMQLKIWCSYEIREEKEESRKRKNTKMYF